MDIQVRFIGIPHETSTARVVKRRISFALDRHASSLRRVIVNLRDENGPRGGVDQHCTLHVTLRRGGPPIVARALSESTGEAVARAVGRVRRRLGRRLPARGASVT